MTAQALHPCDHGLYKQWHNLCRGNFCSLVTSLGCEIPHVLQLDVSLLHAHVRRNGLVRARWVVAKLCRLFGSRVFAHCEALEAEEGCVEADYPATHDDNGLDTECQGRPRGYLHDRDPHSQINSLWVTSGERAAHPYLYAWHEGGCGYNVKAHDASLYGHHWHTSLPRKNFSTLRLRMS